jgi:hypothetical protein
MWSAPEDYGPSVEFTCHNYRIIFPNRDDWVKEPLPTRGDVDVVFYTDESLRDGKAGAGVFSANPEVNTGISLGKFVSIFQAELYAILYCELLSKH